MIKIFFEVTDTDTGKKYSKEQILDATAKDWKFGFTEYILQQSVTLIEKIVAIYLKDIGK